jgi:cobalt-zinc-cadmium efflux system membrane fusion protein
MKKKLLLVFLCHFLLLSVCVAENTEHSEHDEHESHPEIIKISKTQLSNLDIKTSKLEPVNQIPLLYAPAKVTVPPTKEFLISASQSGLVSKLNVAIGDQIEQGQILATLMSPELLTLQRQFLKANSDRRLAKTSIDRDKKLLVEGVISDRRWQETQANYAGFRSIANEAKQLLEIAGISKIDIKKLANTRKLSSQLNIRSPISGVVLERSVVAGERVDMLAPLYRIANLDTLWLDINVPQEQIEKLTLGDKVIINKSSVTATINLLGRSVDSKNQTILARAVINGKSPNVRIGQTVTTQIIQSSDKPAFKIPNAGIAQIEGEYHIFIRNSEGFEAKEVNLIGKESSFSIISSDALTGQEEVAINGGVTLKANLLGLGSTENSGAHSHGGH